MARRKEFGDSWWAQRWISVLESFGWDNRLRRGRSYARAGNVLEIEISEGKVRASVQGSRPRPYKVKIDVTTLSAAEWDRAIENMANQAIFAARLLSGEMPENIEEAFKGSRVSLFPVSTRDIQTECSCPDWANPCKHIAAVCYLIGEEFDRDPFLIFRLRGRTREDIIEALRKRRASADRELKSKLKSKSGSESDSIPDPGSGKRMPAPEPSVWVRELLMNAESEPLKCSPESFWRPGEGKLATFEVSISPAAISSIPAGLLRRLGAPGFLDGNKGNKGKNDSHKSITIRPGSRRGKRGREEGDADEEANTGEDSVTAALARYYRAISKRALDLAYGK
ncbi:MAG: hypothetical protein HPY71_11290 [Firmicutes bacterium]|nr:hypothetical protein [Bacillota bacterium]